MAEARVRRELVANGTRTALLNTWPDQCHHQMLAPWRFGKYPSNTCPWVGASALLAYPGVCPVGIEKSVVANPMAGIMECNPLVATFSATFSVQRPAPAIGRTRQARTRGRTPRKKPIPVYCQLAPTPTMEYLFFNDSEASCGSIIALALSRVSGHSSTISSDAASGNGNFAQSLRDVRRRVRCQTEDAYS